MRTTRRRTPCGWSYHVRGRAPISAELEEQLLDYLAESLIVLGVRAHLDEPALLEHANRAQVRARDPCVQWTAQLCGELRQGRCSDSSPPELAADPVADQPPPVLFPRADVAGDLAVDFDRTDDVAVVREDPAPVRVERLALASGKDRHCDRLGLALLLEEDVEVVLADVAEHA